MPRTVLIVDDHPSFRASARWMLEADGLVVVGEAVDAESAVREAQRLAPEVILLDVQLPDRDGFAVARELLSNGGAHRLAIVLVSSRDPSDYGPLVEESGACGFVPKAELTGERVLELLP